ncbi:hypothetical protein PC116_g31856 [Phytophthora cactorum]|nr:hypothetical protein PC116_g31856 [Phytophthora cactorum]
MDFQDIQDLEAARKAAINGDNEDVIEEDAAPPKGAKTAHHIRANSSIMHLKKLLG